MVDRVHGPAAHSGPHTQPADRARLAVAAQVVLVVADFADRGATVDVHLANLARLEANRRVDALARRVLRGAAGAARELAALARLELDVVDRRADRNVAQRHGVPGLDRRVRARTQFLAHLYAFRRQDVAALAVPV